MSDMKDTLRELVLENESLRQIVTAREVMITALLVKFDKAEVRVSQADFNKTAAYQVEATDLKSGVKIVVQKRDEGA